ncbi:hypothetical protein CEXT_603081 [Caerostris extrusa]|uniref:Uncharacterized protein n=1 Tax=Caerostris extrusa TaxID=172846 RepID=A0AAV4QG84_CAEEX|nr:hypothetical protein CEXT_603081 [Caerostris extrusa]
MSLTTKLLLVFITVLNTRWILYMIAYPLVLPPVSMAAAHGGKWWNPCRFLLLPLAPALTSTLGLISLSAFVLASLVMWFRKYRMRFLLRSSIFIVTSISLVHFVCYQISNTSHEVCVLAYITSDRLWLPYSAVIYITLLVIARYYCCKPVNITKVLTVRFQPAEFMIYWLLLLVNTRHGLMINEPVKPASNTINL